VKPFTVVTSTVVALPLENIDTDQIIPARFLKGTGREGLGPHLFEDLRLTADGRPRTDFPLNLPEHRGASILLAGRNFGCGSSREHAAWALSDHGFRAVLSTSFGDIFFANALKNGLLPVVLAAEPHAALARAAAAGAEVSVDLPNRTVRWPGGLTTFMIDPFAALCLQEGLDQLGYILRFESQIAAYEARQAGRVA
jgi:3-isopropylmalate/(R)-2-methylmalate dehydratase small subunit